MSNTVKYTGKDVHSRIKLDKTREIIENTIQEYEQKYGEHNCKSIKVICVAEFLDKLKNETKYITIESYNIVGELNRIRQSSKGLNN